MQQTFNLRKFTPDDLQSVIQINRLCLPENYMDFFFMDLHQRFPETFIVAEEDGKIVGYIMCRIEVGLAGVGWGGLEREGAGEPLKKKLDFEGSRTIHGYYSDGEDAYVMSKKL